MSDLVLGIDVGTSAVRVAAIDQAGRVAAFAASAMPAPRRAPRRPVGCCPRRRNSGA